MVSKFDSARTWLRRPGSVRTALFGAIALLFLFGAHQLYKQFAPPERVVRKPPPLPVKVATVGRSDIHVFATGLGTVTPIATVNVVTQVNGQITEVAFREGQTVKKGDFLAQIDPRPFEFTQAQYEGQLAHDQGLLDQAKANLVRYQALLKQNAVARQTAEDQSFLVKQYEGSVNLDRALIEQQRLNLAYAHIVAPIDGRIGLRLVDPGNYVQASANSTLAVVTQLQPITVIFPLPEDLLPDVLPQIAAGEPSPVYAYDRANLRLLDAGELLTVDNQIDTTTGMVKLRAKFENKDNRLFPNQFVNARLLVRTLRNATTIPSAAIQHGAPGPYAYAVDAQNKVAVRTLALGPSEGDLTVVEAGVEPGERVVTEGTDRLRDGMIVAPSAAESSRGGQVDNAAPPPASKS